MYVLHGGTIHGAVKFQIRAWGIHPPALRATPLPGGTKNHVSSDYAARYDVASPMPRDSFVLFLPTLRAGMGDTAQ